MLLFQGMAKSKNPWEKKGSRLVYQNPWIKVREDKVVRPDGKDGIYTVVHIPDGVAIVALDEKRNVYLIGEWRYPIGRYSWSVICGTADGKEKPLEAAKRELLEEANMKADSWMYLSTFHPSIGIVDETTHVFLAQGLKEANGKTEGTEKLRVKKVPFDKALEMIERGEITDSYAIVGLLLTKGRLEND